MNRPQFQAKFDGILEKLDIARDTEGSRLHINAFVANVTRNQITNVLSEDDIRASTDMILLNAAFFRGFWARKFDAEATIAGKFQGLKGSRDAKMMQQSGQFNFGGVV